VKASGIRYRLSAIGYRLFRGTSPGLTGTPTAVLSPKKHRGCREEKLPPLHPAEPQLIADS
jgi:hypothetical protein